MYLIDLNMQCHFIILNSPWISNNFCFAVSSGVFAGATVALAAEVRQYLLNKRQAQDALYAIATKLYVLMSVQSAVIAYYIKHMDAVIPENMGGEYARQPIFDCIKHLKTIDYSTFRQRDAFNKALQLLNTQICGMESCIRNLTNLRIVYNKIKIVDNDSNKKITASSGNMLKELNIEYNALQKCLSEINVFCDAFEMIDNKRFNWQQNKRTIDEMAKKIEDNIMYDPANE